MPLMVHQTRCNDYILSLFASGYDGSSFQSPATIDFFVDGSVSSNNVPTRISFSTGSSFNNRTERLKVGSTGNIDMNNGQVYAQKSTGYVGIGTNAPNNRLHVKQSTQNRAIEWQHETQTDFWTVGIGTNSLNCRFEFNGSYLAQISSTDGAYTQASDLRLKQDIEPMAPLLDKVMQLKPSSYYYKSSRAIAKHRSIGFIAQDVEKLFPESVYETDEGFKTLNYSAFSVFAIKVVQEQQLQINELQKKAAETDSLKEELAELRQMVLELRNRGAGSTTMVGSLEQSAPNPVNGVASIRYHILESATAAKLVLTNAKGEMIKTIHISNRGSGQLTLNTYSLASGVYNYTLYVNAQRADTKQLIIAR